MLTVIGVPVYLHYCGGELEKINYFVKGGSCCGEENEEESDCCKDEGLYLQNSNEFTLKSLNYQLVKISSDLLFFIPQTISLTTNNLVAEQHNSVKIPPPKLSQQLLISTSVLRI